MEGCPVSQRWPVDVFKDEGSDAIRLFEPVDAPDVGVVQRGQHLGFAFKPGKAVGIVGEGLRQDLQRHVPVELGVSSSIHLAHAAFADLGGDVVGAEGGAGLQWHSSRAQSTAMQRRSSAAVMVPP